MIEIHNLHFYVVQKPLPGDFLQAHGDLHDEQLLNVMAFTWACCHVGSVSSSLHVLAIMLEPALGILRRQLSPSNSSQLRMEKPLKVSEAF